MSPNPFPSNVIESLLVKSHRRCCICHKFCGTKMEIHHIDPNGPNTEDNCIPLCFDCHAEVRAYDPKHPKGRRFTSSELREHRDQWFAICSDYPFTRRTEIRMEEKTLALDSHVFDSLRTDDVTPARILVAKHIAKPAERNALVKEVIKRIKTGSEETRWKIAYVVEELIAWNPRLVPSSILEEMSQDKSFSVRSSAAVCYYNLALTSPGDIPMNIVTKLASSSEDWYVYTPARACLKRLAKSRPLALDIIFSYLVNHNEYTREHGAYAIMDISEVEPWLLKHRVEMIERFSKDKNKKVRSLLARVLKNLKKIPSKHDYAPF